MTDTIICLDTDVVIKFLTSEEPRWLKEAATQVMRRALYTGRLVAPSFSWVEIGSVLRKKVRRGELQAVEAQEIWSNFLRLPIECVDTPLLKTRAWQIADTYHLATLYDAAFLACTEVAPSSTTAVREFWTADEELLRRLYPMQPVYVHQLGA